MTVLESRKWKKAEYAGQTINMPILGNVIFETDGTLKVQNDSLVDSFIALTAESFDFKVISGKKISGKPEEKEEALGEDQKKSEEVSRVREELDGMDLAQLVELIKETDIAPEVAQNWTDKRLRKELLKKLTA